MALWNCVQYSRSPNSKHAMITRTKSCISAMKSIKLTGFRQTDAPQGWHRCRVFFNCSFRFIRVIAVLHVLTDSSHKGRYLESLFHLAVASGAPVRLLQITDTHLFAGQQETLLGVNTYRSYQAVLAAIRAEAHPFDLIVATGDLAQDHSAAAYRHFAAGVAELHRPCLWLPGNHDFQPAMVDALAQAGVHANKRALLGSAGRSSCWTARSLAFHTVS